MTRAPVRGDQRAACRARRLGDIQRRRLDFARPIALAVVLRAGDEHVELHPGRRERGLRANGRDEHLRGTRGAERAGVARCEVDGVAGGELLPGKLVGAVRPEAVTDHGDRPLAGAVEVDEPSPLRLGTPRGLDPQPELVETALGAMAELVVAQGGQEQTAPRQPRELDRRDRTAPAGFFPRVAGVHDLAGRRHPLDTRKFDPFDVSDDRDPHEQRPGVLWLRRHRSTPALLRYIAST